MNVKQIEDIKSIITGLKNTLGKLIHTAKPDHSEMTEVSQGGLHQQQGGGDASPFLSCSDQNDASQATIDDEIHDVSMEALNCNVMTTQ